MFLFKRRESQNDEQMEDCLQSRQDAKIKELRVAIGQLSGRSVKYCSDECLRRYLVARNWDVHKSNKMMEDSLKWRATYKPEEIRWHEVAHEGETGKAYRANFYDRLGRTVLISRPGMQNTNSPEDNVRHVVYLLENTILNLRAGQEQISWLIDFTGFTFNTNISVKAARDIINIMQSHYPERLANAFLYNPPRIFQAFWKAIRYFLDPKTSQKVKFVYPNKNDSVELMKSLFDMENLPSVFGGKATLSYDHGEFSERMAMDDMKTAKFWEFNDKPCHNMNGSEPMPVSVSSA
ncbi:random slug protein 5-like [Momordica charantia]|uniref:Random slug protein 5-like n=1 Tax=Momordica charantia TaxID=3673 RepID=A0A6J1BUF7_MOMCH|nr:random slug protein 5-like [Momordica charantia]XP_022133232.1 random slug protein 5-like [Momordica charantia]XP_022133233.1 random slug protein 5-like [Momordica charantia]